jgi:hypothetical protein
LDRAHRIAHKVGSRHVFGEIGNVEIRVEHEHGASDGVYDARRAKDGRRVAVEVSSRETFDDSVNLLRFRSKDQLLTKLPVDQPLCMQAVHQLELT